MKNVYQESRKQINTATSEPFDFSNVDALQAFKAHGEWHSNRIRKGLTEKDDLEEEKVAKAHALALGLVIKCRFVSGSYETRYVSYTKPKCEV